VQQSTDSKSIKQPMVQEASVAMNYNSEMSVAAIKEI